MRKIACTLVVLTFFVVPSSAPAAGPHTDNAAVWTLPFGDDLYVAGANAVITEPVAGDLLAAGGSLIINAPVGADLMAAGGSIVVNSSIGDDLRMAGGDITLMSNVSGDVLIYGGSVTIPAGVVVEGDAVLGAGTLNLGGTIRGNLRVDAGTVNFSGNVLQNAEIFGRDRVNMNGHVEGNTVFTARGTTFGPNTGFGGDVTYWTSDGELDFSQVPVSGKVLFSEELKREEHRRAGPGPDRISGKGLAAVFSVLFFVSLLSGILTIAVGIALFRRIFREAGEILHLSFWKGFGVGILTYILLPVASVIILFTVIGIPIGLILMTLFVFSLILGRVITAMVFAAWMERRRSAQWSPGRLMLAAMGLFIVLKLAALIPFLGWVAVMFATLAGYGALVVALMESRKPVY